MHYIYKYNVSELLSYYDLILHVSIVFDAHL